MNKKVQGVICLSCLDTIVSLHRHDYKYCKCGDTFVDGGRDYLRYGSSKLENIEIVTVTLDKDNNVVKSKEAKPTRRVTKKSTP